MANKEKKGMYVNLDVEQKRLVEMVANNSHPRKTQGQVVSDALTHYFESELGKEIMEELTNVQKKVEKQLADDLPV